MLSVRNVLKQPFWKKHPKSPKWTNKKTVKYLNTSCIFVKRWSWKEKLEALMTSQEEGEIIWHLLLFILEKITVQSKRSKKKFQKSVIKRNCTVIKLLLLKIYNKKGCIRRKKTSTVIEIYKWVNFCIVPPINTCLANKMTNI